MNIISFSIWGDNQAYLDGVIANVEIAYVIYPDWQCRVYYDSKVNKRIIRRLKILGAETVEYKGRGSWDGLFQRFLPIVDPAVDRFIVRDTDSRLNEREKAAVDAWVESGVPFHAMRDHRWHNVEIMGGMWGCISGFIPDFESLVCQWDNFDVKGTDQQFLAKYIWPLVRESSIVHDRYCHGFITLPTGEDISAIGTTTNESGCLVNGKYISEYNPFDRCGELELEQFPSGRVVLDDGRQFDRSTLLYEYWPQQFFGKHDCRPFPPHNQMSFGTFVGEEYK